MPSLIHLCNDSGFPVLQQMWFDEQVTKLLSQNLPPHEIIIQCLRKVWHKYDTGGHSCGRSLRSLILEKMQKWLIEGKMLQVRCALSILLAMYYDYKYINANNWYDFKLEDVWDLPLEERIFFSTIAFVLELDDIPLMGDWPHQRILTFLNND